MTPQEIQEKHFHDTFRGYSHEEVDLFLDEVAVAFERLYRENQSFMRRVVDLEEQLKRAQEAANVQPGRPHEGLEEDPGVTESTLKRMLLIAQETADRAVQEARQRAREIQEQARRRADEMMEHAERRVRELSAQRMEKEKELERAKEALRRFDQQYRASFRVFIESQLEALKDLPATPAGSYTEAITEPPTGFEGPVGSLGGFGESRPQSPPGMETVAMPIEQSASEPSLSEGLIETELPGAIDFESPPDEADVPLEGPPDQALAELPEERAPDAFGADEDDPELVRTSRNIPPPGTPAGARPADDDNDEAPAESTSHSRKKAERREGQNVSPPNGKDAEEDRLIRELFWGDDD